jgi:hypothetical protein
MAVVKKIPKIPRRRKKIPKIPSRKIPSKKIPSKKIPRRKILKEEEEEGLWCSRVVWGE